MLSQSLKRVNSCIQITQSRFALKGLHNSSRCLYFRGFSGAFSSQNNTGNQQKTDSPSEKRFKNFEEFYPFYLGEHQNIINRRLHFASTTMYLGWLVYCLATSQFYYLLLLPVIGYGPAWIGHFCFEKNKPATFKYPYWSFLGDFKMYYEIWTGKIKF